MTRTQTGRPRSARIALMLTAALHLLLLGAVPARAESFSASDYLDQPGAVAEVARSERIERVGGFLADERVADQLVAYGVDPEEAQARIAGLTDAELAQLDGRIGSLEAGSGVVGIIGAVFVVLIILELTGVTNVFTNF